MPGGRGGGDQHSLGAGIVFREQMQSLWPRPPPFQPRASALVLRCVCRGARGGGGPQSRPQHRAGAALPPSLSTAARGWGEVSPGLGWDGTKHLHDCVSSSPPRASGPGYCHSALPSGLWAALGPTGLWALGQSGPWEGPADVADGAIGLLLRGQCRPLRG